MTNAVVKRPTDLNDVPLRVEVGPRDVAAGNVVVARRIDGQPAQQSHRHVADGWPSADRGRP
jgi:prolyl-tRNA synthetase